MPSLQALQQQVKAHRKTQAKAAFQQFISGATAGEIYAVRTPALTASATQQKREDVDLTDALSTGG